MNASDQIIESWIANADAWIATIENNDLESRVLVTNNAIIEAVTALQLTKILDIGCGEGWLCRALREKGIEAWGVDAVPQLIEKAIDKDGPYYHVATYDELASGSHTLPAPFDAVVINFALLDKEGSEKIIRYLPQLLHLNGYVVMQTLYPSVLDAEEETGWKDGSWNGMKQQFVLPYQWYYRTTLDWQQLFESAGLKIVAIKEPLHPHTSKSASTIFILQATQS